MKNENCSHGDVIKEQSIGFEDKLKELFERKLVLSEKVAKLEEELMEINKEMEAIQADEAIIKQKLNDIL